MARWSQCLAARRTQDAPHGHYRRAQNRETLNIVYRWLSQPA